MTTRECRGNSKAVRSYTPRRMSDYSSYTLKQEVGVVIPMLTGLCPILLLGICYFLCFLLLSHAGYNLFMKRLCLFYILIFNTLKRIIPGMTFEKHVCCFTFFGFFFSFSFLFLFFFLFPRFFPFFSISFSFFL